MWSTNLHRVGKKADWEMVSPQKRNAWQRLAANTRGVITPANILSIVGALLVGIGLWHLYQGELTSGFIWIAVGRFADLVDGALADLTGTKSSLGEAIDAGIDKLVIIATLVVFLASDTLPLIIVGVIGFRNIAIIALGLLAKAHKKAVHPSRAGKFAAATEWLSILCFILGAAFEHNNVAAAAIAAAIIGYVVLMSALLMGAVAIKDYAHLLKGD